MIDKVRPAGWVALGALVAAVAISLLIDGDAARPGTWWGWVLGAAVVLAATVLAAVRSGTRRAFVVPLLLSTAAVLGSGWLFWVDYRAGTPGGLLAGLAGCALVVAVAMAVGIVRPEPGTRNGSDSGADHPRSRRIRSLIALPLATVTLVGASVLMSPVATASAEHSREAAAATPAPAPELISSPAWTSQSTRARNFFTGGGVVAAGAGFVTARGDAGAPAPGLAGIDGATGELRWTYDLSQATPSGLKASPDGRFVVAVFVPRTDRVAPANRLVVLDATTGKPLWSTVVRRLFEDALLAPTSTVLPVFADDLVPAGSSRTLLGLDLATGQVRWQAQPPDGCSWMFTLAHSTATASLQSQRCDDATARLVAVDQETGAEQWHYTTDVAEVTDGPVADNWGLTDMIRTDPAGTVIGLVRDISGVDDSIRVVLRPEDGSVRATAAIGQSPIAVGPTVVLSDSPASQVLPPGATDPADLALLGADCWVEKMATTATAVIAACRPEHLGRGKPWLLQVQSLDPAADVTTIAEVSERPEEIVVGPGAVLMVLGDGTATRYQAFH